MNTRLNILTNWIEVKDEIVFRIKHLEQYPYDARYEHFKTDIELKNAYLADLEDKNPWLPKILAILDQE